LHGYDEDCTLLFKGTPLMSKSLKTLNMNFLNRSAGILKKGRYSKDN
jgi:hypothetical protein